MPPFQGVQGCLRPSALPSALAVLALFAPGASDGSDVPGWPIPVVDVTRLGADRALLRRYLRRAL